MVDGWEILKIEEFPSHKKKRYTFRSFEITNVDGYNAHRCVQIHIDHNKDDDTTAWRNLGEYLKNKERKNNH